MTSLILRFKAGSHSAYNTLFRTYFPGQVAVARRGLGWSVLADAEDIALSVFHSLWREVAAGRPLGDNLIDRDSLLRTLALLTSQKIRRTRRHDHRQKRDISRTISATDTLADTKLSPDWRACFRETWAELTAGLTPLQHAVIELKLAGHTNTEIAAQVDRVERTVERQLSEVRSLWDARRN